MGIRFRPAALRLVLASGALALTALATNPASAADVDTSCKGLNFVFFPGGAQGDSFASIVYAGAALAAKQTGCHVEYEWSNWNPATMVQQFREAVARKPTGISVMGHPGDEALDPLIDDARKAGIIVTTSNVDLPKAEAKYKTDGMGYVGQNLYKSGFDLGNATIKECGLKKGDQAMVWGLMAQPVRGERTKGAVDALKKAGIDVVYLEISDAINSDASQGIPVFAGVAAAHPNLKALITDHGALTATQGPYFSAAGKKPGQICGAGFDLSAATAQAIQQGWVKVVLDQQPFLQGYLPVMQMYLTAKFGFAGLDIDTGAALITSKNIAVVAPLAKAGIR